MVARLVVSLLLACFILNGRVESFKILVYNSKFGHSHSNYLGQIADILVDAGHNVTSLIPILDGSLSDGTEKSHIIHVQPDPQVAEFYGTPDEFNFLNMSMFNPIMPYFTGKMFANLFERTCKRVLAEPGLIERLRAEQYDVYIAESFDVCGIGLAQAIGAKAVIGASSTCLSGWHFDEFGIEQALSYRPSLIMSSFDPHSLFSRAWNAYSEFMNRFVFYIPREAVNRVLKQHFGSDYPTIAEQSAKVAYVFTNSEPLIESAAPTSSRVVDIPGIGAKAPKPLDSFWEEILNRRPKTVLFSLGSVAKSILLSEASKNGILKAFAQFPNVTFIWKYERPEDDFCKNHASKVNNLVMTKWMPQVDILNHKNLALFITHGGAGSTQETALRGIPGIFIPIFGDQPRNAGMMHFNGLGIVYDKFELHDSEKLAATIEEVLDNEKYANNAKRLSKMLDKKPFTSLELLIKHVEFAAEFGASSALRPQSVNMSLVEYHNLDILLALGLFVCCVLFFLSRLAIKIVRMSGTGKTKVD